LQDKVREQKREGDAHPDDRFGDGVTQLFQSGDTENDADFEKYDGHCEAAGHPLTMLLNFTVQDEVHGDSGGEHPDCGVGKRGKAEGARAAHALFVKLDVEAEWGTDKNSGDVEAADNAMEFCEALAKAIGELHRSEQQRACAQKAVGQQIPFERADVGPLGMFGVDEEAFVVSENVSGH